MPLSPGGVIRLIVRGGVVLAAACLLISCPAPPVKNSGWPAHHPWETEPQLSSNLHVNLFLDASLSMQGFVQAESNDYRQVVPLLESLAEEGGWNKSEVKWWTFGPETVPIPDSKRLPFLSSDFYKEKTTQIDKIFSHSTPSDLTVIVTDLFQSYSDVPLLSRKLDDLYLAALRRSENTPGAACPAVGIVGILTHFQGRVSELRDVSGREHSVPHDGILPFYILVLGPVADVERFLDHIDSRFSQLSSKQRVLFTDRLVRHLGTRTVLASKRDGFSVEGNLIPGASGHDDRVLQLQVPAEAPGKSGDARHLEVTLDYARLENGLHLDPDPKKALRTAVVAETPGADGTFQPDSRAASALNVSSAAIQGEQIRLSLELKRDLLRTGKDYRFAIRVFPAENAYQIPDSWRYWNLSNAEVAKIISDHGFGPGKPGRTLNLEVFLNNLRDSTFLGKEPPIGIAYLYIKAS